MMTLKTHVMFQDGKAQAALDRYASLLTSFTVISVVNYGPEGDTLALNKTAEISVEEERLLVFDSPIPHEFDFTPPVSFFVDFDKATDLDRAFKSFQRVVRS